MNLSAPFIVQVPPFRAALLENLKSCSYVFCNESEAAALSGAMEWGCDEKDIPAIAKKIAALGANLTAVVTQGADATVICKGETLSTYEVKGNPWTLGKADLKDTNGAGDAFVGGFLAGLATSKDEAACVAWPRRRRHHHPAERLHVPGVGHGRGEVCVSVGEVGTARAGYESICAVCMNEVNSLVGGPAMCASATSAFTAATAWTNAMRQIASRTPPPPACVGEPPQPAAPTPAAAVLHGRRSFTQAAVCWRACQLPHAERCRC